MKHRPLSKHWFFVIVLLIVLLAVACTSPRARQLASTPSPTSTFTPVPPSPTPTRIVLVTPTSTPVETPTPTATPTEVITPTATPVTPTQARPTVPPIVELLVNGDFEGAFDQDGVAVGWHRFDNGEAVFVWADETDDALVWEGEHAQLMRIVGPTQNDRYIGIYQTVSVLKGRPYTLSMHGIIRSAGSPSIYDHRIQWGVDYHGGTDWQAVQEWTDVNWDAYLFPATDFEYSHYSTVITPTSESLTLFIRGWSKWAIITSEGKFVLDSISLKGAWPEEPVMPPTGGLPGLAWVSLVGLIALALVVIWQAKSVIAWWRR